MHAPRKPMGTLAITATVVALATIAGCAAGDPRFTAETPAGFWMGLWHGMISLVALVIGIFADGVHVYEAHNTGGWYDFGFVIGVACVWGSGHHATRRRPRRDPEWEEIGRKVEAKLKRLIRGWAEAAPDESWQVVGEKAERKLKTRLREWAESPDDDAATHGGPPAAA